MSLKTLLETLLISGAYKLAHNHGDGISIFLKIKDARTAIHIESAYG